MVMRALVIALSLGSLATLCPLARAAEATSSAPAQAASAGRSPEPAAAEAPEPTPTEAQSAPAPRIHHAPPAVAPPHAPLAIVASIEQPHLVRRAVVVYRLLPAFGAPPPPDWAEVQFLRGSPGPYVATIPEEAVRSPGLEYALELERIDGGREAVFASRAAPHRVAVSEDLMDVREHAALERLGGRRSVVSTSFEYVDFGHSLGTTSVPGTGGFTGTLGDASDSYFRIEGAYTYRVLRTVDDFSVHVGVVRGRSPRANPLDQCADKSQGTSCPVGLNYAAPTLRLRLGDLFRLEGEFLTSVTEQGFSGGTGAALDIGDPYGSKLRVGFEWVHVFGTRFFSEVDIQATNRLRLSPIVEATDMPHADRFGVRLIGEAAYDLGGGFTAALRGGYQAREAASGGASAGLRLMLAF
jgi:hypothetical protein